MRYAVIPTGPEHGAPVIGASPTVIDLVEVGPPQGGGAHDRATAAIAFALLPVVLAVAGIGNSLDGDTGANPLDGAGYVGRLSGLATCWLVIVVLLNTMHDRPLLKP